MPGMTKIETTIYVPAGRERAWLESVRLFINLMPDAELECINTRPAIDAGAEIVQFPSKE